MGEALCEAACRGDVARARKMLCLCRALGGGVLVDHILSARSRIRGATVLQSALGSGHVNVYRLTKEWSEHPEECRSKKLAQFGLAGAKGDRGRVLTKPGAYMRVAAIVQ